MCNKSQPHRELEFIVRDVNVDERQNKLLYNSKRGHIVYWVDTSQSES